MVVETTKKVPPKKKKPAAAAGDGAPPKPKSIKKKKKAVANDGDAGGGDAPAKPKSVKKKKAAATATAPAKPKSVKKKTPVVSTTKNLNISTTNGGTSSAGLPPKVPASPKPASVTKMSPVPASPVPQSPLISRRGVSPGASSPGGAPGGRGNPSTATMNGHGNGNGNRNAAAAAGRSFRGVGPGRGRGAPSSRNIGRNASYDGAPGSMGNIAAPRRPQSMAQLPGVPPVAAASRPQSMRMGMGQKQGSFVMNGGRAPGRGNMGKVLGRNAQSNRNLPPPPGTRGKSKRNLFGSSHHRPASTHGKLPTSSRGFNHSESPELDNDDDDDDDDDEFATDAPGDEEEGQYGTRPASILRRGPSTSKRMNPDGTISMSVSAHSTAFSIDEDEDYADEEDSNEAKPMVSRMPSTKRSGRVQRPGLGANDTDKSMRAWTQSFKWTPNRGMKANNNNNNSSNNGNNQENGDRRAMMNDLSTSKSVRSLLTVDMEFEEEPLWKTFLRYIRILPPHPDEKPIKRNIRVFTWVALFLDLCTAVVSITTFDDVSYCCGKPVLSIAGDIDWHLAIQVTVYLYVVLIFAEILPVMREGLPFNLLNPFMGFLITFGMFFDDRILAAVIMWIIEASAVLCEYYVYRLRVRWHNQRQERLEKTENDIKALKKERKRRKLSSSTHSMDSISSDLSMEESSFHDESANSNITQELVRPKDVSQIRETRLLRERRLLRQAQSEDVKHLRYHFMGVAFNIGLVVFSLLLISMVGRSGGLCIVDMTPPNIFKTDQLERCFECQGTEGECEICRDDGTSQCYFPYY